MKLTDRTKKILERIHQLDEPSTTDLKQDDEILEHYEPGSIPRTLRRLAEDGYVDKKSGRPNRYTTTEDGFHVVKKRRDQKKRRLKEANGHDDELDFEDAVAAFDEYFRVEEIEESLIDQALNGGSAVIDYRIFERINTELADEVLDRPTEMIEAAEVAVAQLSSIDGERDVRFTNLPEYRQKSIRQISTSDVGKLITVPGIVLKASMARPILVNATFECTACGELMEKEQREGKLTSPYKCGCGNREFTVKNREFDDVRILKVQEKPDSPDKKTIKVRVFGGMANEEVVTEMKPGTAVRLTGVVEAEEPSGRNNTYYKLYLSAIDIDEEQNKWGEIKVTDTDRERNREIVNYGSVKAFRESLAADRLVHRDLMKEVFLLFLLGKLGDEGNLHVLVMGEPGTGKSELNNWAEDYLPKTIKAVAQSTTGVGLTATVKEDKDFGGYVAQGGSLTLADGGYHITDEFDKINDEDVANFNESLASGTITLNKGDITNLKLNAHVSEWATANPREYDYFDPNEPKYKQIPVPPRYDATKDRFDVIIGMEAYEADTEEKQDIVRHMLRRGNDDFEGVEPTYTPDELVKFVTEASRLSPIMTEEAEQIIHDAFFSLKKIENSNHRLITNRKLYALKKLSIAYARSRLCEEVTREHAQMACDFFKRSLESIDFEMGKDSFSEVNPKQKSDKRKIREAVENISAEGDEGGASIPDINLETGLSEDRIEKILTEKDNQREFYNVKADLWRVL